MDSPRTLNIQTSIWHKGFTYIGAHKIISTIVVLVVLGAGYYGYAQLTSPPSVTHYITTTVATGTVVASMTETGQVSASSNISVESQASGEVLSIPVTAGEHVDAGEPIAYIDPTTAQENVTSAEQSLEAAQIALEQLEEPAATSSLTDAENSVATSQANLASLYTNGYSDVTTAFLDLPSIINGLNTILHGNTVPGRTSQENEDAYTGMIQSFEPTVVEYSNTAESSFQTAQSSYNTALAQFEATPRDASNAQIASLVQETYQASIDLSDALKASTNFLNFVNTTLTDRQLTIPSTLPAQITSLTNYTNTANTNVNTLSSDVTGVTSDQQALTAAQAALAQLQAGADPLSIQSAQLSVQEKQDALAQAQQALADTVVTAPFSGTVAQLNVQQYQTIGDGTDVATMVSDNQNVDISVNEVDDAKLQVGQKATLTFDALPDVSIAGTVSSVDAIGTVSSGVVSYNAVVTFDTPNASVKPGMSATADIITGTQTGLLIPSSAVKTTGTSSYVQVFNPPLPGSNSSTGAPSANPPTDVFVTTGLTDDTNIIVESGLTAGEQVVTQTISGSTAATTVKSAAAQSTSLFGAGGIGGGGATRAFTRG